MSLILSLALATQTAVALDPDPVKGPVACAYSVSSSAKQGADMMLLSAQVSYYAMHAARDVPGGKPFFTRVGEIAGSMGGAQAQVGDRQAEFLLQCDQRFPLARGTAPAKLPADPFQHDMMCLSISSLMVGAAQGAAEDGNDAPLKRFQPLMTAYGDRLSDERVKAAGIADIEAMGVALGKAAEASLDFGNPEMISQACETALKA